MTEGQAFHRSVRAMLAMSVATGAIMANTAMAQESAPAAQSRPQGIEEIVVSARKRAERIVDVPFAITAIGQSELQDRGAIDIKDVQFTIPGLNIQELSVGNTRIQLRGINPGAGTGLPIVSIYVDEVGIGIDQQQRDGAFPLVDLERVEVLRGPQGTLYGEGSVAGTIRYITRNPSLTDTDGYVEANLYQQTEGGLGRRFNGAVGAPIINDRVGLRIAGGYDVLAGWIDYPQINAEDVNETTRWFIRPKLYALLSESLTFSLLYQYYDQDNEGDNLASATNREVRNRPERFPGHDRSHLLNAIFEYDFGPATLTSSTGYQFRDLLFQPSLAGFRIAFDTQFEQWNQEVRVSSNGTGPIQYVFGGWYRNFESNVLRRAFRNGVFTPVLFRSGDDPVDSESMAVFGDVTWNAAEKISLSLGGRYYTDERSTGAIAPPTARISDSFDSFSPRASVQYTWNDDASSYVTVSKGFRSGGFNGSGTSYGPETLWNYEVGTKAALLDGALFLDVAAYYVDYKDRQAQASVEAAPGIFRAETRNVGEASGFGLEGAVTAKLGAGVQIDATAGWNNIESDTTNAEVVAGERFDFVAAFTGSASVSQRLPVAAGLTGLWRVDYQYSDPYNQRVRQGLPTGAVVTLQNFRSEAQGYLNARIGVEGEQWSLSFDIKNILDEDALLIPVAPISSSGEGVSAAPMSYGVTFRWNFGN